VARRSRSSFKPIWLVIGLLVFAVAVGIGGYLVSTADQAFRTIPPLEVQAYLENSNSLRGNTYRIDGEVLNQLSYSPSLGRLISVQIHGTGEAVPVVIPSNFGHVNIQRGQRFLFKVEVTEQGILRTLDLTKA